MFNFIQYLTEEKNTHMTHIEDLVLDGGVKGARQAITALISLRDMLAGHSKQKVDVTVKWDGAPAVFCGKDPSDGRFFVAKKGIFNKNPKVYKSHSEIDADASGDLADKLKIAFDELQKLDIDGVVQGDIMFTNKDLKSETIDGTKYWIFHPNTIAYAVDAKSEEGRIIRAARIGVVFHTRYTGDSFENMSASYGIDVSAFKKTPSVWAVSANLHNLSGTVNMTETETEYVTKALSRAGQLFRNVPATFFNTISDNEQLNIMINTYNNTFFRNKTAQPSGLKKVDGLINFIKSKFQAEIDKRKTADGKKKQQDAMNEVLKVFDADGKKNMANVFEMQYLLSDAKLIIINKLNALNMTRTFVKTSHGYKVTKAEGFVAIDTIGGGAVKLVDRLEFSTNNFDPDVIKGWQSATRR
jgi:hypothetical protein